MMAVALVIDDSFSLLTKLVVAIRCFGAEQPKAGSHRGYGVGRTKARKVSNDDDDQQTGSLAPPAKRQQPITTAAAAQVNDVNGQERLSRTVTTANGSARSMSVGRYRSEEN